MAALKINIDKPKAREFEINGVTVEINPMDAALVQTVYDARQEMQKIAQLITPDDPSGIAALRALAYDTAVAVLGHDHTVEIWPEGCPGEYEAVQMLNWLAYMQQIGRAAIYAEYAPKRIEK
ncbi:MAG: hypothetical protein GX625_19755 [Clostridiaceae bacterium]|nr:hypothetical protein [Clostridiaceae bacterium]